MDVNPGLGLRIMAERKNLNLSRDKLAELLNVSPYFIGQIERGKRKMSFDTFVNLGDILHVSLDYLVKGDTQICKDEELNELIKRCSRQEKALLLDVLKASLPHLGAFNK
jgi:transcriptional regulator with XRE-family HTH domain